jgi:predicted AlkP superfamily pyrophosphatase or phosphodiesterase
VTLGTAYLDAARKAAPFAGGIAPSYEGQGLVNVANTVLTALGIHGASPLAEEVLPAALVRGVRRVLLILVDGLGFEQLESLRGRESLSLFDAGRSGSLAPITTVAPSTTTSAVASACTGEPPIRHGLLGYRLLLKELGVVANMIRFAPVTGGQPFDSRGVEPRTFFTATTLFERLKAAGVRTAAITRRDFLGSALSKMVHHGAEVSGFASQSDLAVLARRVLDGLGDHRGLIFAYWDLLDGVSHRYGALGDEYRAELAVLDFALQREVLSRRGDGKTLVLLTADHGHVNVPPERRIDLRNHPEFLEALSIAPAGEPRFAYLYSKPGRRDFLLEYARREFGSVGVALPAEESVRRGYFGPGPGHPAAAERLGDVHLVPVANHAFLSPFPGEKPTDMVGRHGGFTPEEMLVPLLAMRL